MNFEQAISFILKAEGGWVNDSDDNGGETKFGISKNAYPNLDIASLTIEQAKQIYKKDYWDKIKADQLPEKIRLAAFDSAVNQGIGYTSKALQESAGDRNPDGHIGPNTIKLINSIDSSQLLSNFIKHRLERYKKSSDFNKFGKGWLNRLSSVEQLCNKIA